MALNVSIEGNPFARPCPLAAVPLSPDGKGRLHCEHCRKQVSDLRGLSLFQVAVFVRGNPEACIIMGAAWRRPDSGKVVACGEGDGSLSD
jgi:hypothetical protein